MIHWTSVRRVCNTTEQPAQKKRLAWTHLGMRGACGQADCAIVATVVRVHGKCSKIRLRIPGRFKRRELSKKSRHKSGILFFYFCFEIIVSEINERREYRVMLLDEMDAFNAKLVRSNGNGVTVNRTASSFASPEGRLPV